MNPNNGKAQAEVAPGFEMEAPMTVPRFDGEHKKWIIDCLIDSVPYQSMSKVFRVIFPNFAPNVPDEKFYRVVKNRFRDYRHKYKDEIDKGRSEGSDGIGHIPMTKQRARLEQAQLALEEWEPRSLVRIYETKNGEVYKIYKDNTKQLIVLLRYVREEVADDIGHIPVTRKRVRLEYAQLALEEWQPRSLARIIRDKERRGA